MHAQVLAAFQTMRHQRASSTRQVAHSLRSIMPKLSEPIPSEFKMSVGIKPRKRNIGSASAAAVYVKQRLAKTRRPLSVAGQDGTSGTLASVFSVSFTRWLARKALRAPSKLGHRPHSHRRWWRHRQWRRWHRQWRRRRRRLWRQWRRQTLNGRQNRRWRHWRPKTFNKRRHGRCRGSRP